MAQLRVLNWFAELAPRVPIKSGGRGNRPSADHREGEVPMSHPLVQFLALTLALTFGVPAASVAQELRQERLFAIVPVGRDAGVNLRKIVEIDTRPSALGVVLREWPLTVEPPEPSGGAMHAVGAGRYVVWVSGVTSGFPYPLRPVRLNVLDTVSGTMRAFDNLVNGPILTVDNKRGRVFFLEPQHIAVLDARTGTVSRFARPSGTPAVYPLVTPAAYAEDVDRLFVPSVIDFNVDVFDVATGTVVQRISPAEGFGVFGLATDPAGTRLYTTELIAVGAYDTATAQRVARTSLFIQEMRDAASIQLDPERRRLLVGSVVVFDADSLRRLGAAAGACAGDPDCLPGPRFTFFGPRSPLLSFTSKVGLVSGTRTRGCISAPLEARHPLSGELLAVADLSAVATRTGVGSGSCVIQMAMTTVPPAPRALASNVQGRRVTLSWTDPGNTEHFQVEAGSAPGAGNLFDRAVAGNSLTIGDVPAGTYYVRVRAVNYVGRSVPVEIAIVVR